MVWKPITAVSVPLVRPCTELSTSADMAEPRKGMPLAASPIVFTIPLPILSEPRP